MGNVHTVNCVMSSEDANNNLPSLMKRTCQRISFKRSGSSSGSEKSSTSSPPTSPKAPKPSKKRMVLNTMPRCSSFENLSMSSKKADTDPTYLLWKRAFEQRRSKPTEMVQTHLARMRRRVHNMSSAVSGHLTPKGFPAFIQKRRQSKAKKPMQLPQLNESPRAERKIPVMYCDQAPQVHNRLEVPQYLAQKVTLTGSSVSTVTSPMKMKAAASASTPAKPKYTLAPLNLLSTLPQSKQAIIIEQLYRDIKDVESRYDTQMDSYLI